MSNSYSYKIENINYFLIFLIVCLHSSLTDFVSNFSLIYNFFRFISVVCDVAVPCFFLISSYLLYNNYNYSKYPEKLKKRFYSLVIPYFLWSTIMYLFYAIVSNLRMFQGIINENYTSFSINSAITSIVFAKNAGVIWFIRVLMVFAIISPIVYFITSKLNKFFNICFILILCVIIMYINPGYSSFVFWLPVHFMGCFIRKYFNNINIINKSTINNIIMSVLLFCLILIAFFVNNNYSFIYSLYRFLSIFPVLYLLDIIILDKKIFNVIDSFFVFCIHIPIIQFVRKVLIKIIGINNFVKCILVYVLTIILTFFLIYLITMIMKKIFSKFYYILIGNRKKV